MLLYLRRVSVVSVGDSCSDSVLAAICLDPQIFRQALSIKQPEEAILPAVFCKALV